MDVGDKKKMDDLDFWVSDQIISQDREHKRKSIFGENEFSSR